jgi:hypothetical protein
MPIYGYAVLGVDWIFWVIPFIPAQRQKQSAGVRSFCARKVFSDDDARHKTTLVFQDLFLSMNQTVHLWTMQFIFGHMISFYPC